MASYLLVNKETNIVDNAVEWDGDTSKWLPPDIDLTLNQSTTESIDWVWDAQISEWVAAEITIGNGGIGDTWNGETLIKPKPSEPPVEIQTST